MPSGGSVTARSRRRTSPAVGSSRPPIQRNSVVLPQPDGPTTQTSSPAPIENVLSPTASTARASVSYVFLSPRTSSTGPLLPHAEVPAQDVALPGPEGHRQPEPEQAEQHDAAP